MKALSIAVGVTMLFLAASCGGVVDENDPAFLAEEAELAAIPVPVDAGTVDAGTADGGPASDGGTAADGGTADAGTKVAFACPAEASIDGQAAAAYCCVAGHESGGDSPTASCVSDWCVSQCQSDCGSNPFCYTSCYGACRNGVNCTCGGTP
jgi:hypothetical protein